MSDGAYQRCEVCGNRVHMNHTCKQWNKEKCEGDPWKVREKLRSEIAGLKKQVLDTELTVKNLKSSLEEKIAELLKSY